MPGSAEARRLVRGSKNSNHRRNTERVSGAFLNAIRSCISASVTERVRSWILVYMAVTEVLDLAAHEGNPGWPRLKTSIGGAE